MKKKLYIFLIIGIFIITYMFFNTYVMNKKIMNSNNNTEVIQVIDQTGENLTKSEAINVIMPEDGGKIDKINIVRNNN